MKKIDRISKEINRRLIDIEVEIEKANNDITENYFIGKSNALCSILKFINCKEKEKYIERDINKIIVKYEKR